METLGQINMIEGTLRPAEAHRFVVRFLTTKNEPIPELDILTKQNISISPREIFYHPFSNDKNGEGSFQAEFQIDDKHSVIKALYKLNNNYTDNFDKFNICVEYLDTSGNVTRKTIYKSCYITNVKESKLDYSLSSSEELIRIQSRCGQIMKTDEMVEAISKNELWSSIQMVIEMLKKSDIRIITPVKQSPDESLILKVLTNISYLQVENIFPE